MAFQFQRPDNDVEFEKTCLRFYRKYWKNESLVLYGKRGERQDGIDIFDPLRIAPIRAVQCKLIEAHKEIKPETIRKEVAAVEKSTLGIERYIIATTARRSRNAHDTIAELNDRSDRKVITEIHFWEDLCDYAAELGRIVAELIFLGENLLAGAPLTAAPGGMPVQGVDSTWHTGGDADERFAVVERLINERRLDVARHELDKLQFPEPLSSETKYGMLRLQAKLALESGEFATASQLFLDAFSTAPELDQAKQNRVLGLALAGRSAEAFGLAKEYIIGGLNSSTMVLHLIDTASSIDQIEDNLSAITPFLETDESINTALVHKYLRFGDREGAAQAVERAKKISPNSPYVHLAAGLTAHNAALVTSSKGSNELLQRAIEEYNAAEQRSRESQLTNLLPEIHVNRAKAKQVQGDVAGAEEDYRAAVVAAREPAAYAIPVVRYFLARLEFSTAWEFLEYLDRSTPEGQFLALVTDYHLANHEDKRTYLDEMIGLADHDWTGALESRFYCVQWALDLNDHELAMSCVPNSMVERHPLQAHILLAWIHWHANAPQLAQAEVDLALKESAHSAHPNELRLFARILTEMGDDSNAVTILEQIVRPGVFDDDMKSLLNTAIRLERHDLLLRLCRELRENGQGDAQLRRLEIQLLNQYLPEEGFRVAEEYAQSSEDAAFFVAARNTLALRLGKDDELNLDPAALPKPADLAPSEANLVLYPYAVKKKYDELLRFLYAQRRHYFEVERAHGAYIFAFLNYETKTNLREPPETVEKDCAVRLATSANQSRWIIIEDADPVPSRGEFSSESEIAKRLMGRHVGETIELPGNLVQIQSGRIREIQTKYVRVFQDSIENFRDRFPDASVLQSVSVGDAEHFDPSAIIESLKGRRDFVEGCIETYRDYPCSLFLFADAVGINELIALQALATHPKGVVKCCQVTAHDFERAVSEGVGGDTIVLTISAIITLTLLDEWRRLDPEKKYLVAQSTIDLIDDWVFEATDGAPRSNGTLAVNDEGQLVFTEMSDDDHAKRLDELRKIKSSVTSSCRTVSSVAVAGLPAERRDDYYKTIGSHNLESICVAQDQNAELWSDDLVVGFIARTDFGVSITWSQLYMQRVANAGRITQNEFQLMTAKLASWDYSTIYWSPETIIAAGEESNWDPGTWPFSHCIGLVGSEHHSAVDRIRIVVGFLKQLRQSSCSVLKQSAVIQAVLNAMGDARGARWLLSRVDQLFPIDIPWANTIRLELSYWLQMR